MSSLKGPGRRLSVGWVKRLLRTALPLGNTISIYFNDEPLSSAKSNIDVVNEWILGEGLKLGTLSLPDGVIIAVEEHSSPYPHLLIEGIGPVTGRFRLYSDRISGGKSENIEVSNGFFVNVRGRVIKPEDPYFGLDNLSHSVWARFRATIRADGLDSKLSVNRESISDSRELRIFRAFLGPVDKPDPSPQTADQDKADVTASRLIVARGDPALLFQMANAMLDPSPQRIYGLIDGILHGAVSLRRDLWRSAAVAQVLPDHIAVVSLVRQQCAGVAVALRH